MTDKTDAELEFQLDMRARHFRAMKHTDYAEWDAKLDCEAANLIASLRKQLDEAREREAQIWRVVSAKAREWSGHYEHGTDGRNTFGLFAEWAESAALSQEPPASHAPGLRDADTAPVPAKRDPTNPFAPQEQNVAWPTAPAPAISGGEMVSVPRVATEAMIEAGWIDKEDVDPQDIWAAMVDAALAAADRSAP